MFQSNAYFQWDKFASQNKIIMFYRYSQNMIIINTNIIIFSDLPSYEGICSYSQNDWFAPSFVNYQKGTLDSQPQVIKLTSCLSMVGCSLRVLWLSEPLKTGCHDNDKFIPFFSLVKLCLTHSTLVWYIYQIEYFILQLYEFEYW
jgi:hypothetical protein